MLHLGGNKLASKMPKFSKSEFSPLGPCHQGLPLVYEKSKLIDFSG